MSFTIKSITYTGILLLIAILSSCKKNDINGDDYKAILPYKGGPGVYVCGYTQSADSGTTANVWKDGVNIFLKGSIAMAMTSQGDDIYIAGLSNFKPVYWKNGVQNILQAPAGSATIDDIAVSGNDVYVLGSVYDGNSSLTSGYWKNGVIQAFPTGFNAARIATSGSDVYMAGRQGNNYCYWKNGTITNLPNGTAITAITVLGNDVYITGFGTDPNTSNNVTMYWKNGAPVYLTQRIYPKAIFVKGNDVYIAGVYTPPNIGPYLQDAVAAYTKNNILTTLNSIPGQKSISANGIYVDKNDNVYISGEAYGNNVTRSATYWKNGEVVILGNIFSIAYDIVVIQ